MKIGTDLGFELCASDVAMLDEDVAYLRGVLGVESTAKQTVYVYPSHPPQCNGTRAGCYLPRQGIVASSWSVVRHELVHAVVYQRFDPSSLFWNEGLAEALSGFTYDDARQVVANMEVSDRNRLNYQTAGHVSRWLLESGTDVEDLARLAEGASVDEVLARTPEQLEIDYVAGSPFAYPDARDYREAPRGPCPDEGLVAESTGEWSGSIAVDCDNGRTTAFAYGRIGAALRFDPPAPGSYRFEVSGDGWLALSRCVDHVLPSRPQEPDEIGWEVNFSAIVRVDPGSQTVEIASTDPLRLLAIGEHGRPVSLAVRVSPEGD